MAKKKASKKEPKPPPRCKAILLCDQAIIEAGTGKKSLIGVFNLFVVRSFPGAIRPYTAFLQLVDGIGKYQLTIEIHDVVEDVVIAKMPAVAIQFQDRTTRADVMVSVPPMVLAHPGDYDFVVFANGQVIDHQSFEAVQFTAPQQPPQGDDDAADENE